MNHENSSDAASLVPADGLAAAAQIGVLDAAFWGSFAAILGLLFLSAFFSGSETALTAAEARFRAAMDSSPE